MAESTSLSITGGAKIGFVNYTWPLATLSATADELIISTSAFGLFKTGKYRFQKDQVVSIDEYGLIPFIGKGVRIVHNVQACPQRIIFWCSPASTLKRLSAVGFMPAGEPLTQEKSDQVSGVPFRWLIFIGIILIWNLLLGFDVMTSRGKEATPGIGTLVALCLLSGLSIASFRSEFLQSVILKPGRSFGEIQPVVALVALVSTLLAVAHAIYLIVGVVK